MPTRFLLFAGASHRLGARWSSSRTCEHYGWDRRLGLSTRLKKWRVCRAKGVYNLSDGMLPRRQLYRPRTYNIDTLPIVDTLNASDRENTEASGGKTHRRSIDPSNEFRCRDYLWDRCRPGRQWHRHFIGISRHIPRRQKNTRKNGSLLVLGAILTHIPERATWLKIVFSFRHWLELRNLFC